VTAPPAAICDPTWGPEPDDEDDTPHCHTPGLLPEQHTTTINPIGGYL